METDSIGNQIEFDSLGAEHIVTLLPDASGEVVIGWDTYRYGPYSFDFSYGGGNFTVISEHILRIDGYSREGYVVQDLSQPKPTYYWLDKEAVLEMVIETRGSLAFLVNQDQETEGFGGYRVVVSSGEEAVVLRVEEVSEITHYPGAGFIGAIEFERNEVVEERVKQALALLLESMKGGLDSEMLELMFNYDLKQLFGAIMLKGRLIQ